MTVVRKDGMNVGLEEWVIFNALKAGNRTGICTSIIFKEGHCSYCIHEVQQSEVAAVCFLLFLWLFGQAVGLVELGLSYSGKGSLTNWMDLEPSRISRVQSMRNKSAVREKAFSHQSLSRGLEWAQICASDCDYLARGMAPGRPALCRPFGT